MDCTADQIANGTCTLDVNSVLCIKGGCKDGYTSQTNSVDLFVQDVFLTATIGIGTVITIALIVSGIKYILAGAGGDLASASEAKKGIQYAFIGLALVASSYSIIRLIQYLVSGYR